MLNNFPPLKRRKNDTHIIGNCLHCNDQQQQDGSCPHQSSNSQLASEFQLLRAATEDPTFDMDDIERRLRKLETKLTSRLQDDGNASEQRSISDAIHKPSASNANLTFDSPTQPADQQTQTEPDISLTSTGINITTNIMESHHFVKLLIAGINPTFVQQTSARVFTRHIELTGPTYDNPMNDQVFSNLAIDKEHPSELQWFDMVLTTRYSMCFLVYQMVEKDRLVEWVSQPFIDGLKGQVKLEHSLLAKSVRAFVYNHEKISDRHEHDRGISDDGGDPLYRYVNLNRGAFYFQQAQELLELCYMTSSRNTIRSLLHMYMYQLMNPDGLIKAIQYSDLAIRMAQALKLDTEKGMLVNEQLREDDRRLWWSTVWVHLWSCMMLNRPFMVEKSTIMGPRGRVPSKRQDESSQVGYCIDFCVHSVKLILLSKSIGLRLGVKTTETKLLWELQDIEHQLHAWSLALPEVLQPRFWANGNRTQHSEHMNDIGRHDHGHTQSLHLFAVDIGILLHGQWARIKMQIYECFWTNDGSILDLLVVRNRLQVAVDHTNYLAHSVDQLRPCLLMYLVTTMEPSLSTLNQLTAYKHNRDMVDQSIRQLYVLKSILQRYPFTDVPTCHQWIHDIDQTLLQCTPRLSLQPDAIDNISTSMNWPTTSQDTNIMSTNESSVSYSDYLHQDQHVYQPYLQQSMIDQGQNSLLSGLNPTSVASPFILLGTDISQQEQQEQQHQQHQQQHGWMAAPRTTVLDEIALHRIQNETSNLTSGRTFDRQPTHQLHHVSLPNNIEIQGMTNATSTSTIPYLQHVSSLNTLNNTDDRNRINSDNNTAAAAQSLRRPSKMPSPQSISMSLPSHHPPPYLHYHQQQQNPQEVLSTDQEQRSMKAAGKQPNWSSSEIYPDSSSLDPEHHTFLPYPPSSQYGRHYGQNN
ncbi:hypothetical protein BCR42DRAFT_406506 [Absidia repens]|uniref:Xylanolytic transcriptional activator regulatory domain-containing protein n=1 Tax=Absidia repens TaxID=90262 RepID=A0A1X2IUX5_9FUNG|nr:hypothetical protein BCR42DRAFT_406506 [Absidia repens]